jgi:hypothetical protein
VSFLQIGAVVPHILKRRGEAAAVHVRSRDTILDDVEVAKLLDGSVDFVMLPLTMPNFGAVRLAEMAHLLSSPTRIVLASSTSLPAASVLDLFDGFVKMPNENVEELMQPLAHPVRRSTANLDSRLAAVLRADCFGGRHGGGTTLGTYRARISGDVATLHEVPKQELPVGTVTPAQNANPWRSGSFYLFSLVVLVVGLAIITQFVSAWLVPVVVITAVLFIVIVGAFQLRHDDRIAEKTFLRVVLQSLKKLPLLRARR